MPKVNTRKRGITWEYYFESAKIEGKRKRITNGGYSTQKEALIAGNKALSEFNNSGLNFVPAEISVSDYLDYWMTQYCETNLKPETLKNYRKKLKNHIKPALGKYKLRTISSAVLQDFIYSKFNEGYSRNTLISLKSILSSAFTYAVEPLGFIQNSPMVYVKLPSPRAKAKVATRKAPHVYLTQEIINKIFTRFPEGTSTYIPMMLAYRCGTRPAESFAFFWEDIDFIKGTISVNRQVQWDEQAKVWYFSEPKYDSFRTIELDSELLGILQREKEKQERAKFYFENAFIHLFENENRQLNCSCKGTEIHPICIRPNGEFIIPRSMQHTSRIIHYELNIPDFDMHSFRVTHATMLAEKGAPPIYTKNRLGHKNIEVTLKFYTRFTDNFTEQGTSVLKTLFD